MRANESSWPVPWWHSRIPVSPHPVGSVVNFYRNSLSMARTYPYMPPSRQICRCASFAPVCCNCCQIISVSLMANRARNVDTCEYPIWELWANCKLTPDLLLLILWNVAIVVFVSLAWPETVGRWLRALSLSLCPLYFSLVSSLYLLRYQSAQRQQQRRLMARNIANNAVSSPQQLSICCRTFGGETRIHAHAVSTYFCLATIKLNYI